MEKIGSIHTATCNSSTEVLMPTVNGVLTYISSLLALLACHEEGAVSERSEVESRRGWSLRLWRRSSQVALRAEHSRSFGLNGDPGYLEALFDQGCTLSICLIVEVHVTKPPVVIHACMIMPWLTVFPEITPMLFGK